MAFLTRVLEPPRYGYSKNGTFYVPTKKELAREFFSRLNFLKTKKNWLAFFGWTSSSVLAIPFFIFLTHFLTLKYFLVAFIYSMVILGTHGTIWYHRYCTHRAYQFRNSFWRFLVNHMVIRIIPEETYVVSHHVHHQYSEQPGDPYNVNGGWWYCFLADVIHQPIAKTLSEEDYFRVLKMLDHTGIRMNSYQQYQKWGSVCHPFFTLCSFSLNWIFWYSIFFLIGGHPLAITLFGCAGFWAFGVRTFNFSGHGSGKDKRRDGVDFNRKDLSINQLWPGLVTGEWHNNHHLYPNGARAGFLPYQLDYAWYFIRFYKAIGGITSYRDYKQQFLTQYYSPYLVQHPTQSALSSLLAKNIS
ncbi:MAG: acyl-CoA desaturase [Proteobacteria bacterium]|nr:acyl-CoA desaturase [Pseudomonadota bacterium]NDC23013.1 acyl-CoA desaturase [Pseudomonadota bacterium]NDG25795.1 acyl-CoA desaturase [Pseudomonadota bacterium]